MKLKMRIRGVLILLCLSALESTAISYSITKKNDRVRLKVSLSVVEYNNPRQSCILMAGGSLLDLKVDLENQSAVAFYYHNRPTGGTECPQNLTIHMHPETFKQILHHGNTTGELVFESSDWEEKISAKKKNSATSLAFIDNSSRNQAKEVSSDIGLRPDREMSLALKK